MLGSAFVTTRLSSVTMNTAAPVIVSASAWRRLSDVDAADMPTPLLLVDYYLGPIVVID